MKKALTFALALAMLLALCACGVDSATAPESKPEEAQSAETPVSAAPEQATTANSGKSRVLVVYFSRTGENYTVGTISKGNTAIVAGMIAESTGADAFEIIPMTPYPDSYDECLEVATQEQRSNARPEYEGEVEAWEDYDTVFFGYSC